MLHIGSSPNDVTEAMAAGLATVYNWQHHWHIEELEGLAIQYIDVLLGS